MKKQDLYMKLSEYEKKLKELGFTKDEIDFLKTKISKDKLGLYLNYTEMDKEEIENYFGLSEIKELGINVKENEKNNLLIEGDNYHALKALKVSNVKVDVIYIDPPYNTGKDFVYNDDFGVEKVVGHDDAHKHSKWLSFMKKRLELAKELLSDEGVIFVSIDDNEQAYLKVLMDEIFGEENFVENLIPISNPRGKRTNTFGRQHEYIIVFSKNVEHLSINGIMKYGLSSEEGLRKRGAADRRVDVPNLYYPIYINPENGELQIEYDKRFIEVFPIKSNGEEGRWRWGKDKFNNDKNELFAKKKNTGAWDIFQKVNSSRIQIPFSIIDSNIANFEKGTIEIQELFGNKPFEYPKPVLLIKWLIERVGKKNATILDFFAGSGTTGQAIMELNSEDDGNRRFILITNNENNHDIRNETLVTQYGKDFYLTNETKNVPVNTEKYPYFGIARAITRERLFRVINQKGSKGEEITWSHEKHDVIKNNSVKYLQVKPINKVDGEFEEIDEFSKISEKEFDKKITVADFE